MRVVIAEDAAVLREGLARLLGDRGHEVCAAIGDEEALRAAEEAECIVYSIIVVPIESSAGRETGGEHALIQLSEDTGGRYYYATSMSQLDDAFRQISEELRTQYIT